MAKLPFTNKRVPLIVLPALYLAMIALWLFVSKFIILRLLLLGFSSKDPPELFWFEFFPVTPVFLFIGLISIVLFSIVLTWKLILNTSASTSYSIFIGALGGLLGTFFWPIGGIVFISFLAKYSYYSGPDASFAYYVHFLGLLIAIPFLIAAPLLGALIGLFLRNCEAAYYERQKSEASHATPSKSSQQHSGKEECPWCEDWVTRDVTNRCPNCDRPF